VLNLSQLDNVLLGCAPWKGGTLQWCKSHPGASELGPLFSCDDCFGMCERCPIPEVGRPYSIISLARPSSVSRRLTPNSLAVFRLIANSNLVGSCTSRRRLGAFEAAIDVSRRTTIEADAVDSIRNQVAGSGHVAIGIDRRQLATRGNRGDEFEVGFRVKKRQAA